jgi:adenine-specific DNA-methyltransferase
MPTLNWIGKDKVINHHLEVPFRVLDHQYGFTKEGKQDSPVNSGNLIIHGDNLEALKALLPQYEGKIKCIYIDPPYNTGNEGWAYNDNVNDPKLKKWLHQVVGKEGEDLSRHDKWLCMMYPRLVLLHQLLSSDGSIFISIDDNEHATLKLVMDELFGMRNYITSICWQKIHSIKNDARHLSVNHDYIVLYAKNVEFLKINLLSRSAKMDARYKNPDNDERGPWQSGDLVANEPRTDGNYDVFGPHGDRFNVPQDKHWVYSRENMMKLIEDKRIWFGRNGKAFPRKKRFLFEVQDGRTPDTWWTSEETGHNQEGKREVKKILDIDNQTFSTPKPVRLVERVIEIGAQKNSIILDSFAGSGTTAHAVLNLNKIDGGNRRYILVEMEDYAETITSERAKRVIQGYSNIEGTGGSFDYFELGLPLFDENHDLNNQVLLKKIREYIWFSETRSAYTEAGIELKHNPYYLGVKDQTGYYFYFESQKQTTLDYDFLSTIKIKSEQYVIYADNCLLTKAYLQSKNIVFKKIPRDISRL